MMRSVMLLLVCAAAACDRPETEPDGPPATPAVAAVAFDTGTVRVETATDTQMVRAQIAAREDQRAYGLMDRDALDADAGMIFIYDTPQAAGAGFWMYRTRIPLDIAYFDSAGRIVSIMQMEPCRSSDPGRCPSYVPGATYFGALEMNRGWFAAHGVAVGDRIVLVR